MHGVKSPQSLPYGTRVPSLDVSYGQPEQTVEIQIEPQLFESICRRGHRRLREIRAASQASLKLHHPRRVLEVKGTESGIAQVFKQLESLTGHHVSVKAAVWAELMRTRTNPDPNQAAIARIQKETECRVHIERTCLEIRLFGGNQSILPAQRLLSVLESICTEEVLDVENPSLLNHDDLRIFAEEFGITLLLEPTQLRIFGIKAAVNEASQELRSHQFNRANMDILPARNARMAIGEAMAQLSFGGQPDDGYDMPNMKDQMGVPRSLEGAVVAKLPPTTPAQAASQQAPAPSQPRICSDCGSSPQNMCVGCGQPVARTHQYAYGACQKCGVANFCSYCGHPIEKNQRPQTMVPPRKPNVKRDVPHADQVGAIQGQGAMQGQGIQYGVPMMMPNGVMAMMVPVPGPNQGNAPVQNYTGSPVNGMQIAQMTPVDPQDVVGGMQMARPVMMTPANDEQQLPDNMFYAWGA